MNLIRQEELWGDLYWELWMELNGELRRELYWELDLELNGELWRELNRGLYGEVYQPLGLQIRTNFSHSKISRV